jgi:sec-independent protein translocase protein TatC
MRLVKMRRIAYFVLAVIAITLTPPDFLSDFMVMIPLLILYEVSIGLSKIVYRKQKKEDAEWERTYEATEENHLMP